MVGKRKPRRWAFLHLCAAVHALPLQGPPLALSPCLAAAVPEVEMSQEVVGFPILVPGSMLDQEQEILQKEELPSYPGIGVFRLSHP